LAASGCLAVCHRAARQVNHHSQQRRGKIQAVSLADELPPLGLFQSNPPEWHDDVSRSARFNFQSLVPAGGRPLVVPHQHLKKKKFPIVVVELEL